MPLMLKACGIIQKKVSPGVVVSGSFTGPFTLAAILRGFENYLSDILDNPDFARRQLEFAAETGLAFASAFLRRGASVAINDSFIAPPLLSPALYGEFVFEVHRNMIAVLKGRGAPGAALIAGGNTTPIIEKLSRTGTSLVMADWNCDRKTVMRHLKGKDLILRACVEPRLIETGSAAEMEKCIKVILDDCGDYPKLVIGCGIVSINTVSEKVLAFRDILKKY
jgi:uroporphyrinogen decarboxylase